MNKNTLLLLVLSLVAACGLSYQSGPLISDKPKQNTIEAQPTYYQTAAPISYARQETFSPAQQVYYTQPEPFYAKPEPVFEHDVILKAYGDGYVSYAYKNVHIDDVAKYAEQYCLEFSGQSTNLVEIVMRPDHSMLATFECTDL